MIWKPLGQGHPLPPLDVPILIWCKGRYHVGDVSLNEDVGANPEWPYIVADPWCGTLCDDEYTHWTELPDHPE